MPLREGQSYSLKGIGATVTPFRTPFDSESCATVSLIVIGSRSQASADLERYIKEAGEAGVPAASNIEEDRRVEVLPTSENLNDWKSVVESVFTADAIVLVFNQLPPAYIRPLLLLTMKRRVSNSTRRVHVVDNFASRTQLEENPRELLQHPRVRDLFKSVVKLTGEDNERKLRDLARAVIEGLNPQQQQDTKIFESTGSSFAWNLASTFLRLVVPNLDARVSSALYEGDALSTRALADMGITVPSASIIVVKKYFVLLPEQLSQSINPVELFPGCVKKNELTFTCEDYERKVFIYLIELRSGAPSGPTHALLFADWASPIFNIQKMDIKEQQGDTCGLRASIFQQFKEDLKLIHYHPQFSELLFEETNADSEVGKRVELLEVASPEALQERLEEEVQKYCDETQIQLLSSGKSATADDSYMLVKMGSSLVEFDQKSAVLMSLERLFKGRYKLLAARERMSQEDISQFRRIVFVLEENERDCDFKSAAAKMNVSGECCISVIIVGHARDKVDIHDLLPDYLKHLPYCCVKQVPSLSNQSPAYQIANLAVVPRQITLDDVFTDLHLTDANCLRVEDVFPLMSMTTVLTANICCGFVDKMEEDLRRKVGQGQEIPFSPPYFLVLPTSSRYPDPATLQRCLEANGAVLAKQNFTGSNDRTYDYKVWVWEDVRLAFEVPGQFSYLHRQLELGFIGLVNQDQVSDMLNEFGRGLKKYCKKHRHVKVIEWEDCDGFCKESHGISEDRREVLAEDLLKLLRRNLTSGPQ